MTSALQLRTPMATPGAPPKKITLKEENIHQGGAAVKKDTGGIGVVLVELERSHLTAHMIVSVKNTKSKLICI